MVKNYYHRSFIILKSEETGYSVLSGKDPAGYCKLEIRKGRGRIQIYVQNLKPIEQKDGVYEVYLVSEDSKVEPINLTSIRVDERGRGEKTVEFNVEDINASGYSLEMFHALAVVFKGKDLDGEMKIGYPLVGYSSKNVKVDWTGQVAYYLKGSYKSATEDMNRGIDNGSVEYKKLDEDNKKEENDKNKTEDIVENKTYIKQQSEEQNLDIEQQDQEENLEIDEIQSGNELQKAYQDTYQEFSEDIPPDLWQKDHENEMVEESSAIKNDKEDIAHNQILKDDKGENYWDNVKDYFTSLFKTHRLIQPFDKDVEDAEWIRVQNQPPGVYPGYYSGPYYNQTYSSYNQMYYGGTYFEHYIVGLKRDQNKVKYVVYGIPSMYSMIPPTNISGFSRWAPVKNGYGMGYWLIYIDASTGCVVYPYGKE